MRQKNNGDKYIEVEYIVGNDHTLASGEVRGKLTQESPVDVIVNNGICTIAVGGVVIKVPTEIGLKMHDKIEEVLRLKKNVSFGVSMANVIVKQEAC